MQPVANELRVTPVRNQTFSEPFEVPGPPEVFALHRPFMLTELEFHHLQADASWLSDLAKELTAALVVLIIATVIRWVAGLKWPDTDGPGVLDAVIAVTVAVAAIGFYLASRWWPGKRVAVVSKIQAHFESKETIFGAGQIHERQGQ